MEIRSYTHCEPDTVVDTPHTYTMLLLLLVTQLCSALALARGRIIGGEEAGLADAPWQVGIGSYTLIMSSISPILRSPCVTS